MMHLPSAEAESIAVLKLVASYGGGLDLSGPRVGRTVKTLANDLLKAGYLTGTIKALDLTDAGRAKLPADK